MQAPARPEVAPVPPEYRLDDPDQVAERDGRVGPVVVERLAVRAGPVAGLLSVLDPAGRAEVVEQPAEQAPPVAAPAGGAGEIDQPLGHAVEDSIDGAAPARR